MQQAHVHAVNQQGVAPDIESVHQQGGEHGNPGIAHGAEKSGAGVIQRQERIG